MKIVLTMIVSLLTAFSLAALDVKLEYHNGWKITPAVTVPGPTLTNFLNVKDLNPQLFGLVGIETPTDRFSLAGGLRFPTRLSDNLSVSAGPWVILTEGSKPRVGLFVGFSFAQ